MPQIEIGFLCAATDAAWKKYYDAFKAALTPNVFHINYLSAGGDPSQYDNLAGRLAAIANIKVIVTAGTEAALACENAVLDPTNTAVVFASAGDPVSCGLVPAENVTGCSNMQTDDTTVHNRVRVMKGKLGPINKVGVIGNNPRDAPLCPIDQAMDKALYWLNQEGISAASKDLGQWSPDDFQSKQAVLTALGPLKADGVDRLLVCSDPVVSAKVRNVIEAAHDPQMRMKTMHEFREHVDHPNYGDQCYGPSFQGLFTQAGSIVNQIRTLSSSMPWGVAAATINVYQPLPGTYDEVP
jgi:ABC transporter substrate binding protein